MPSNQHHLFSDKSKSAELQLATILAKVTHHVHPLIVEKVVEANKIFRAEFSTFCKNEDVIAQFFYEGSDCVFPGLRRPINAEKDRGWKNRRVLSDDTILNDNTYPRHLWTYLSGGQKYSGGNNGTWNRYGLNSFELAHIFAHKCRERDFELTLFRNHNNEIKPYSLFTSASNVVLIPKWLPKPTDKSQSLKKIFYKRHLEPYGKITSLPGLSDFNEGCVPEWYSSITWSVPKLPNDWEQNIGELIAYRNRHLRMKYS